MPSVQQHINKIAEVFFRCGGDTAIICPGSRNAPLITAFARHPKLRCIPVTDERSAGFIGLGIARQTRKPVVILCTSGTAALNFYPAICEAFYQGIPLVVVTADRPPELIDQWDGQAIRQRQVFRNHILDELSLEDEWMQGPIEEMGTVLKELILLGMAQQLPVHINVPLREPFYPGAEETYTYSETPFEPLEPVLLPEHKTGKDIFEIKNVFERIRASGNAKLLVLIGANHYNETVHTAIRNAQLKLNFPIIADIVSGYTMDGRVINYDLLTDEKNPNDELMPDFVLSVGGPMLSKNLKKFIRNAKPRAHIHMQHHGHVGDPFGSLTSIARTSPEVFFRELAQLDIDVAAYRTRWMLSEARIDMPKAINSAFSEARAALLLLRSLPAHGQLHLANSMPVRYAMLFGVDPTIAVSANRGTSGIDGCSSAAVGIASATTELTVLLTGDMAFFYDVNAFWNKLQLPNLRIIILNNGGGGIFRLIDGPSGLQELEAFMENAHSRDARHIAADFNFEYLPVKNETELDQALTSFYKEAGRPKILEVFTTGESNASAYKALKAALMKQLN